jgi:hypothetical protein
LPKTKAEARGDEQEKQVFWTWPILKLEVMLSKHHGEASLASLGSRQRRGVFFFFPEKPRMLV